MQIGHADFKQAVERSADHVVVEKFFGENCRADAEVAIGARQQIGLQPRLVFAKCRYGRGIGLSESPFGGGVRGVGKRRGHILFKKADGVGKLFERDFGINFGNVLQVGARRGEISWKKFFARNHGTQPFIRRSEFAAHNDVNAVGSAARIGVGIFFPAANHFE